MHPHSQPEDSPFPHALLKHSFPTLKPFARCAVRPELPSSCPFREEEPSLYVAVGVDLCFSFQTSLVVLLTRSSWQGRWCKRVQGAYVGRPLGKGVPSGETTWHGVPRWVCAAPWGMGGWQAKGDAGFCPKCPPSGRFCVSHQTHCEQGRESDLPRAGNPTHRTHRVAVKTFPGSAAHEVLGS